MTRKMLVLNGIAILMVPLYHAAAYTLQAMFEWTNQLLGIPGLNFDQLGSLTYHALIFTRELEKFAVPAFLFVSGFFIAFMARGNNYRVSWEMVTPRIKVLLPPFILWTGFRFAMLMDIPDSINELFQPYWFILMLIQGYLLSPVIVPLAKKRWPLLLLGVAFFQVGAQTLRYLTFLGYESPVLSTLIRLTPMWFFPFQIMNFTIGVIAGVHLQSFKAWITRWKWVLLAVVVSSGILSFVEYQVIDILTGPGWIGSQFNSFTGILYASTFSLAFLAFEDVSVPYAKYWSQLGTKSLGIYMGNIPAIYLVALFLFHFTPGVLWIPWIYMPVLALAGLGIPLLLMEVMKFPRMRWAYRYVFG